MVGAAVSLTSTLKDWTFVFPRLSVAVHDTVVLPYGKLEPDEGLQLAGAMVPASFCVAVYVTVVAEGVPTTSTWIGAGSERDGAVTSLTVTVKLPFATVRSVGSVAEQFTVVSPYEKSLPDAGSHETATSPFSVSDALAE
jgi:hypothetical protein